MDVSAKLHLVPSLLSSCNLKTDSFFFLRAGSIKGKNCGESLVIHFSAITWASAQTRHRPPGMVQTPLALAAPPWCGNDKVAWGQPAPVSISDSFAWGGCTCRAACLQASSNRSCSQGGICPLLHKLTVQEGESWQLSKQGSPRRGAPRCLPGCSLWPLGPSLSMGTNSI